MLLQAAGHKTKMARAQRAFYQAKVADVVADATARKEHLVRRYTLTGFDPSWISLLHLRFYSGNNLCVHRNVPMFYRDLWPACARPKLLFHLCYQKNSDCPTLPKIVLPKS